MKSTRYFLAGFMISTLFSGCFQLFDSGSATTINVVFNPSKTKQAIVFIKGGNATEPDSYQVSIKDADDDLGETEVGNTFTVDSNHGTASLNSASITLKWVSDNDLNISYDKKLRTFIQMKVVNRVIVVYQPR